MYIEISLRNEQLLFHHKRFVYWKKKKTLLLSDPHIGKVMHFRKSGIPLPQNMMKTVVSQLEEAIHWCDPERIMILGDLFHSDINHEWQYMDRLMRRHLHRQFQLVPGNHDRTALRYMQDSRLEILPETYEEPPFTMVHEASGSEMTFTISGHIHPGVRLQGTGHEIIKAPCFWLRRHGIVLPAFSDFTGKHIIQPTAEEAVAVAVGKQVKLFKGEYYVGANQYSPNS